VNTQVQTVQLHFSTCKRVPKTFHRIHRNKYLAIKIHKTPVNATMYLFYAFQWLFMTHFMSRVAE